MGWATAGLCSFFNARFFAQQRFANHWFSTATPTFLIKLLRQKRLPAYTLEALTANDTLLESASIDALNVYALLFQTGYLTIKRLRPSLRGTQYTLGYPNYEVAEAFSQYLLADYLDSNANQLRTALLSDLNNALATQNVARFVQLFQSLFAGIPYILFLEDEAYYHSVVYLVLRLLNFQIDPEKLTNVGRIDAVLELDDLRAGEKTRNHLGKAQHQGLVAGRGGVAHSRCIVQRCRRPAAL